MIKSKKFKMSFQESKVVLDRINFHRKMYLIVAILQIRVSRIYSDHKTHLL